MMETMGVFYNFIYFPIFNLFLFQVYLKDKLCASGNLNFTGLDRKTSVWLIGLGDYTMITQKEHVFFNFWMQLSNKEDLDQGNS